MQSLLVQRDQLATLIGVEEAKLGEVDTVLTVTPREYDEAALLREAAEKPPGPQGRARELQAAQAGLTSARLGRLPYVTRLGERHVQSASARAKSVRCGHAGRAPAAHGRSRGRPAVQRPGGAELGLLRRARHDARNAQRPRRSCCAAQNAYDVLQRNLAGEVHEAALTYQQALASEAVARPRVASATENMKLTQQKYNVGSATILDLIDAQVQLQRAQSQRGLRAGRDPRGRGAASTASAAAATEPGEGGALA